MNESDFCVFNSGVAPHNRLLWLDHYDYKQIKQQPAEGLFISTENGRPAGGFEMDEWRPGKV